MSLVSDENACDLCVSLVCLMSKDGMKPKICELVSQLTCSGFGLRFSVFVSDCYYRIGACIFNFKNSFCVWCLKVHVIMDLPKV